MLLLLIVTALYLPLNVNGGPIVKCIDHNGLERSEGESWDCEDGCNTCGCSGGQITSTLALCQEPSTGMTCTDHNSVERREGESWNCEDGCNTCGCSGGQITSTLELCQEPPTDLTCTDHKGVEHSEGDSWDCEDGCNTCGCSGGQIISTLALCEEPPTVSTCTDHNGDDRSEGESWDCEDGCNTCSCSGGQIISTLAFCQEPLTGLICIDHNGVEQSDGTSWECEDGCNTCGCREGQIISTLALCQEPPIGLTCTDHNGDERSEGESWDCEDGCNTCGCRGGQIISTLALCQEPLAGLTCTDHNGGERSDGESWDCEDGCNTCGCRGGQIISTLALCQEPPIGLTCTDHNGVERSDGESWDCEDGCNTCGCRGGQIISTLALCQEPPIGLICTDHNGVERSEGESWDCEDGCNICGCSGGLITSTLELCQEPPTGMTCTDHNGVLRHEGETWLCEDGCNTCRCSGNLVTSTLILCIDPPPGLTCSDHNGVERSTGESWECEDGCNTCTCDGGLIIRTEVFCLTDPPSGLKCVDHAGVERGEGESWVCEDECNTCTCSGGQVASTYKFCGGLGGGIEDSEINEKVIDVAQSAITLLDATVVGGGDCTNLELVEVLNVRTQVVAGTNYFLSLRLATNCPGEEEERICENVGIYEPLSVYCKDPNGCLELVQPQQISCRLFSPNSAGSCSFSHECLTNGGSCASIQDASCVCNFGRCQVRGYDPGLWIEGVNTRTKECSAYTDCPCRNQTDTCFCIEGQCVGEAWECHADNDCYILNKCNGKQCKCQEATCEWQCNTDQDCLQNNQAFYCQHDKYQCRCKSGQCDSVVAGFDDSGEMSFIPEDDVSAEDDYGPCTFSHDCFGDEGACRNLQDAGCVCNFGRCLVRGFDLFITEAVPRIKQCSTHQDCPCRNETEKCFCIDDECVNEAWECHEDKECSKLEKCEGKQCKCTGGTCEFQCDTTEDCTDNNSAFYCQHLGWKCKCELGQCKSVQLEEECVEPDYGVDDPELTVAGLSACVDLGKCEANAPCECLQNYCSTPYYVRQEGNCREETGTKDCSETILDCSDGTCECANVRQIDPYTRLGVCAKIK